MYRLPHLPILMVYVLLVKSQFLPDFSGDIYTEDIWEDSHISENVYDIRYDNEDKPRHCRIDICETNTFISGNKGTFLWPDTQLETRVFVRCPYAVHTPVYAYRDCIFSPEEYNTTIRPGINNSLSDWDPPITKHCPDPPLEELVEELLKIEASFKLEGPPLSWYSDAIDRLHDTMTSYRDAPVRHRHLLELTSLVSRGVLASIPVATAFSRKTTQNAVGVINELFTLDIVRKFLQTRHPWENERLLQAIMIIGEMWTPKADESHSELISKYLSIGAFRTEKNLNFKQRFSLDFPGPYLSTNVSVMLKNEGLVNDILHLVHIGHTNWPIPNVYYSFQLGSGTSLPSSMFGSSTIPWHLVRSTYFFISPIVYVSVSKDHRHESGKLELWSNTPAKAFINITSSLSLIDEIPQCAGIDIYEDFHGSIRNFNASKWYLQRCGIENMRSDVTCHCSHFGFHALVQYVPGPGPSMTSTIKASEMETTTTPTLLGSSFSEFLGFPYSYELYITGNILRAVSVVCLLLTIIFHLLFSKGSMSVPSRILLHLSVSLILFNVTLYIAEYVGYHRWGCRISNILRYYLVMVSLGWNVTEAVNLYLMLVRVFKSHIRYFVLKASLMAWGLPLIPIIIVLATNERGFDGKYFDDCSQKCVLKDPVFYYAYMLPLVLMVLGNTVIFGLVVKVLRRHGSGALNETRRSSALNQLSGAMSMMFLLGIPWIFSAFGVLNVTGENDSITLLSGIFQVISVVFLSVQGTFIFLFHCVRNTDIRKQWNAAFKSRGKESSNTSGSSPNKLASNGKHTANKIQSERSSSSKTNSTRLVSNSDLQNEVQTTPM